MEEYWKLCAGLETTYEVSTLGNIRHVKSKKIRKIYFYSKTTTKGKPRGVVSVRIDGKQKLVHIHRLIALTFIPNPNNYKQVNHIDGNPSNNAVSNLEWCDQSYNMKHSYNIGLHSKKDQQKFTAKKLQLLYDGLSVGFDQYAMARAFCVDQSVISDIINGKTYKDCGIDFSIFSKSYYTDIARTKVAEIQSLHKSGISSMKISEQYNVSDTFIRSLIEMI